MKNIAIVALLAAFAAIGATVACGGSTPPAMDPGAASAAPTDMPAPSGAPAAPTPPSK